VQYSKNIREGIFRKLYPFARHVYIYVDSMFVKDKTLGGCSKKL